MSSNSMVFKSPAPSHKKGSNGSYYLNNNGQGLMTGNGATEGTARYTNGGNYLMKSPMISSRSKFANYNNDYNSKPFTMGQVQIASGNSSVDINNSASWIISPVCSRLRDHIQMVELGNGIPHLDSNVKGDVLFQSPTLHAQNVPRQSLQAVVIERSHQIHWPLSSPPALD